MGHNMATWKLLEDMMIQLRKKGIQVPTHVLEDLRAAKSMIKLSCIEGYSSKDAIQKAEELTSKVEAFLVTEAQNVMDPEKLDKWLRNLGEVNAEECERQVTENKFVAGVPRDQKWVRVEPIQSLPTERILQIAKEQNLAVTPQKDGRLVVYGQPDGLKVFLQKMTTEAVKK